MTDVNITYSGASATVDVPGADSMGDGDLRRVAIELVRSGIEAPGTNGLYVPDLPAHAFNDFMVDRFTAEGRLTVYLRPKVPFGGGRSSSWRSGCPCESWRRP